MIEEEAQNEPEDTDRLPEALSTTRKTFGEKRTSSIRYRTSACSRSPGIVPRLARDRECRPARRGVRAGHPGTLLQPNVHYHGIDISIPEPAENLLEADILEAPIDFRGMKFNLVVAQGLFEYVGEYQSQKFAEIAAVLKDDGKFVLTYQNFDHRQREIYWPYSNVQRSSTSARTSGASSRSSDGSRRRITGTMAIRGGR